MAKILHFSDIHLNGDGYGEKGLEEIINHGNAEGCDTGAFTGDGPDGQLSQHFVNFVNQYAPLHDKDGNRLVLKPDVLYRMISANAYQNMEQIVSGFNGGLEGIWGNHDTEDLPEIVKSINFKSTDKIGRFYFECGQIASNNNGFKVDSDEIKNDLIKNQRDIMLWHDSPFSRYFDSTNKNYGVDGSWAKDVANKAKINLSGHHHMSYVSYDKEHDTLNVNMSTEKGYYAIIEHSDDFRQIKIDVYKNENFAKSPVTSPTNPESLRTNIMRRLELEVPDRVEELKPLVDEYVAPYEQARVQRQAA